MWPLMHRVNILAMAFVHWRCTKHAGWFFFFFFMAMDGVLSFFVWLLHSLLGSEHNCLFLLGRFNGGQKCKLITASELRILLA